MKLYDWKFWYPQKPLIELLGSCFYSTVKYEKRLSNGYKFSLNGFAKLVSLSFSINSSWMNTEEKHDITKHKNSRCEYVHAAFIHKLYQLTNFRALLVFIHLLIVLSYSCISYHIRSCSDLYPGCDVWLVSTLYMAITGWLSWLTPHNSNHHRHTHSPATTPSAGHGHGVKTSPWFSYNTVTSPEKLLSQCNHCFYFIKYIAIFQLIEFIWSINHRETYCSPNLTDLRYSLIVPHCVDSASVTIAIKKKPLPI